MVEFECSWVLTKLKGAIDVPKVVVLEFDEARDHVREILLVLSRSRFVLRGRVTFLLNDARGIIKWSTGDEALLARRSLDIQNETVSWELHTRKESQDAARLDVSLPDRHEAAELARYHQVLVRLVVYLVRDLSLSELEGDIPEAHQGYVDQ